MKTFESSTSLQAYTGNVPRSSTGHNGKVLIVDDDLIVREIISNVLGKHGYKVTTAASIKKAELILRSHSFGLVFLDLMFPGQSRSGLDMIENIKLTQSNCAVVIITASSRLDSAIKALRLHVFDYLLKPINLKELHAIAERAMPRHDGRDGLAESYGLTAREKEVLNLLGKGFHYSEVAELLDCRISTIQTHVKHIYRKLQVHSCAEAIHESLRLGLIG